MRRIIDCSIKDKIINDYLLNVSIEEIKSRYDISRSYIHSILRKNNISPRSTNSSRVRLYKLDEQALDDIDTEEKAYFLGFFCADGYNSIRNRCLRIKLAEQDIDILKKFANIFKSNKPIYKYRRDDGQDQVELVLSSKKLSDRVINLGINTDKTYKLEFPLFIKPNLVRHFIRGYFDGDGTIGIYGNKTAFSIISTKYFCNSLKEIFKNNLNINSSIIKYPKKYHANISVIAISGNKQIRLALDYLYKDSTIYLERKYNKYIEFLNLHKQ